MQLLNTFKKIWLFAHEQLVNFYTFNIYHGICMIEIIKFKEVNRNTLKGYVDIFLPNSGLEIYGCTYHVKGNNQWVNMPQKEITLSDGSKKYFSITRFREANHRDAFSRAVLQALKNYKPSNTPNDEEEVPF